MKCQPTIVSALVLLAVAVSGCSDDSGNTPTTAPTASRTTTVTAEAIETVASGIAQALAEPELRAQVLEDMRDSPLARHKLHLPSYLAGDRGWRLASGAAAALKVPVTDFTRTVAQLRNAAIFVPSTPAPQMERDG